ncbi:hypothetical protein N7456_010217 [Penicillium angulare]|uniref:Uncharacterized protein n=1 Tax=Penicillium angulare TaxID=116970 RepID=A0A9W9F676_9EURO|nr:hypothetical protein N7456_010217 [Penicillium angulare]
MSFLSTLCGCFSRSDVSPRPSSQPEMQDTTRQNNARNSVQTGRFTLSGEGEFIRAAGTSGQDGHGHGPPPADSERGYTSVDPLPQYTPRPISIHEKTLEAHLRDPPISSDSYGYHADEKSRGFADEDIASDTASTFSYPSSYGNTSTATRETPPPAYSPRHSVVLARSRSISVTSAMAVTLNPPPMARISGRITAPSSEADDMSIRRHRRVSWESR